MLRGLIATELESGQILKRKFGSVSTDHRPVTHRYPMADVTSMHNNRKHQPSKVDEDADMSDSDSDFETDTVLVKKPRKAMTCVSERNTCIQPMEWDDLHPALQTVLPAEEGLTYVMTEFTPQKKLTPKQQQKASEAKSKNSRKVLTHHTRMKKADCPSKLTVTVLVPSKRDRLASEKKPYLVTHPMVLRVTFNHNHPLKSAHALSFRPISQETKELFIELFRQSHTAASAHEKKLYLDGGEDHTSLADRAYNPTKSDI